MIKKNVLLGLTTTSNSNWREKINEINKYNIKDIALFLTGIEHEERKELYSLLEDTGIKSIYHVHARGDMSEKEMQYLVDTYDVRAFNIHSIRSKYPSQNFPIKFQNITYIENTLTVPDVEEIKIYAGLCIDFSHWEAHKFLHWKEYSKLTHLANTYNIGCCHVSAVNYYVGIFPYDSHLAKDKKGFNYLKKYIKYLPQNISLELENSFEEQLQYKKYIEKIIS